MRTLSIVPVAEVTQPALADLSRQAQRLPFRAEVVLAAGGGAGAPHGAGPFVDVLRSGAQGPEGGAGAVRAAVARASGELVLLLRPDGSVPLAEVLKLVPVFERGAQVVIGSRYLGDAGTGRQPWHRRFAHALVNSVVRLLMLGGVRDSRCGFKCFSAQAARHLCAATDDASPDIELELLGLARRLGFSLAEVPVRWEPRPRGALAAIREDAAFLAGLLRVRWRIAGRGRRRVAEGAA